MQRTISWTNPTAYADGTVIGEEKTELFVHVWKDGVEVYETLKNVTEFPIEVTPGVEGVWQLQAELSGQKSELSSPLAYTEPFQKPMPPTEAAIS